MRSGWTPPPAELAIGIGFYATRSPGTGGRIKVDPEDFRVEELSLYPAPVPGGPFTVLRVLARNWEQHELARALARALGLPPTAISWAGTKDRRAVTEQLLSYRGEPPASALPNLRGVELVESYTAARGVVLGHHFGNRFAISVREVPLPAGALADRLRALFSELTAAGRFPNFFGPQRFGEVRPVTHEVGRFLLRGDSASAVESYLTLLTPHESPEGRAAREAYAADHDPVRALRRFPPAYRFERALLDHLARGERPARALRALPRELRRLFVHAYQSLLFNRYLTRRDALGLSLTEAEAGDHLLRVSRDGTVPGTDAIPVGEDNLSEARELLARGRAELAGPLIGRATPVLTGRPGEILGELLSEERVDRAAFSLPEHPDIASEGTFRSLTAAVPPLGLAPLEGAGGEAMSGYRVRFSLPKGCYATVLLRELLKSGATAAAEPAESSAGLPSKEA